MFVDVILIIDIVQVIIDGFTEIFGCFSVNWCFIEDFMLTLGSVEPFYRNLRDIDRNQYYCR